MMKKEVLFGTAILGLFASTSVFADKVRINVDAWNAETQSEFLDRYKMSLSTYDAISSASAKVTAQSMGGTAGGSYPIMMLRGGNSSQGVNTPVGLQYFLDLGKNSLVLGYSQYTLNPTFSSSSLGMWSQSGSFSFMGMTANGAGSDMVVGKTSLNKYELAAKEYEVGFRLALGDHLALTPHLSSYNLDRTISGTGLAIDTTTMSCTGNAMLCDAIVSSTASRNIIVGSEKTTGSPKGNLFGLGAEVGLSDSFGVILDYTKSAGQLSGSYSSRNMSVHVPNTGSSAIFLNTASGKTKDDLSRAMLGVSVKLADSLRLRIGYRQETHTISYSGTLPLYVTTGGGTTQTTANYMKNIPSDFPMILIMDVKTRAAKKDDSNKGVFFGVTYDISFGGK